MIQKIFDLAQGFLAVGTIVGGIAVGAWFFVDDEVGRKLNDLTGATEKYQQMDRAITVLDRVAERLDAVEVKIDHIAERVDLIESPNVVFEMDMIRSLVHDDCPTEGMCKFTLRLKRTERGRTCDLPTQRYFVKDRFGVTHPVMVPGEQIPKKATDEWGEITGEFILPEEVPTGIAEFYVELKYPNCFEDAPDRVARETTMPLTFFVNPR